MAIRKKIRTVTMLTVSGETSPVILTTTYLKSLRSLTVPYGEKRRQMYYSATIYVAMGAGHGYPTLNERATALGHDPETTRGRTGSRYVLQRYATDRFDGVSGPAFFDDIDGSNTRYARVVSIRETPTIRNDFTEWAADQFPPYYRPVFLWDQRGAYVACEHPDERTRDAWLTFSKVRWG